MSLLPYLSILDFWLKVDTYRVLCLYVSIATSEEPELYPSVESHAAQLRVSYLPVDYQREYVSLFSSLIFACPNISVGQVVCLQTIHQPLKYHRFPHFSHPKYTVCHTPRGLCEMYKCCLLCLQNNCFNLYNIISSFKVLRIALLRVGISLYVLVWTGYLTILYIVTLNSGVRSCTRGTRV